MILAKSYTLVKEYPNSLKVGSRVFEYKTLNNTTTGYILSSDTINPHTKIYTIAEIENNPTFWEQLK